MEVIIQSDETAAANLTARIMAVHIGKKPNIVLGLATGRTMVSVYAELASAHRKSGLDFSGCTTFNLDEYVGLAPDHPQSYRTYMNEQLFKQVNIDLARTHLPHGAAANLEAECRRYEDLIKDSGGIDLQLLGIGESGHIGFNEPLSALFSRTREKALTQITIDQNSPLFDRPKDMPRRALTMGVGTILDARRIVVLVTGKGKADILAQSVEGPITAMVAATALQLHPATTVIVDEAAAANLAGSDHYRWAYENEPEWQQFRAENS